MMQDMKTGNTALKLQGPFQTINREGHRNNDKEC